MSSDIILSDDDGQNIIITPSPDVEVDLENSAPVDIDLINSGQGLPGEGVPLGGTDGQVLTKLSSIDYDTAWETPSGGGAVDSVNGQTGIVVLDADDISDTSTTHKFVTASDLTQINYLDNVTSDVQTQLNTKIDGTGVSGQLPYWFDANTLGSLSTATYPSMTELSYVKGVTSSIQTQLDSKVTGSGTSIDNAMPRYSGTGGKTIEATANYINDAGDLILVPTSGSPIQAYVNEDANVAFTIQNYNTGTMAGAGSFFTNDVGEVLQFYIGSDANGSSPSTALFRSTGGGGLNVVVDTGVIAFSNDYTFGAGTEYARFLQTGILQMNSHKITQLATPTNGTDATTKTYVDTGDAARQPLDSDLTTIAGLTATTDNFIQSKSSAWASRTPTQVTADLINFVGDSGAGGTKGLVPAPASGDAAAGKYLKSDGTWTVPPGAAAGITRSINSISSTTSAGSTTSTDYVYLCTSTFTLTLPTAVGNSNRYTVKNAGVGTITIATTSSQTIDGTLTITITPGNSVDIISTNSNWNVI